MKDKVPWELEKGRIISGPFSSPASFEFNGAFHIRGPRGLMLFLIVSDGLGWEHASVEEEPYNKASKQIVPPWEVMCFVKDLIWKPEETVLQYHPAKSNYVNVAPHVLHLWRPLNQEVPLPPIYLV